MDIRQITPTYFVAPQIDPADLPAIAEAGITCVICNRPDEEIPVEIQADVMEIAAKEAGVAFVRLPLTHQTMTPEAAAQQRDTIAGAEGAVLAYCASGTRSTVVWALGQAGSMPTDDILSAARAGGYTLDNLRPTLDAIAQAAR